MESKRNLGESQADFELRVLHGRRLGAIIKPLDSTLPIFLHPTAERVATLAASADLRKYDPPIFDQGQLGSCVANASCGAFQWLQNYLEPSVTFTGSRLALYKWARDHDGSSGDVGTTDDTAIWVMTNTGMAHESLWPYDIGQFDVEPPSNVVTDAGKAKSTSTASVSADTNDIKTAVSTPLPVVFSFEVYSNYDSVGSDGLIPMPGGSDVGGHDNVVVGYSDTVSNVDGSKGAFLVRNSWGTSWGMAGYGWMPYAFADQGLMSSAYVIKAESEISVKPSGKCPDGSTPITCPDGSTVCPPATCGGGGGGGGANLNITVNVREHQRGIE